MPQQQNSPIYEQIVFWQNEVDENSKSSFVDDHRNESNSETTESNGTAEVDKQRFHVIQKMCTRLFDFVYILDTKMDTFGMKHL